MCHQGGWKYLTDQTGHFGSDGLTVEAPGGEGEMYKDDTP